MMSRWHSIVGALVGIIALLGFVGFSSAQKTSAPETTVWDTARLNSGDNSFDEHRLRLMSEGWEPFSTSSYQDGNTWYYYLHFRKRVSLAAIQKQLVDVADAHSQELASAGYKLLVGDEATKRSFHNFFGSAGDCSRFRPASLLARLARTLRIDRRGCETTSKALQPFLGEWAIEGSNFLLQFKQSGRTVVSDGSTFDVCIDKQDQTILVKQTDVQYTAQLKGSKLTIHASNADVVLDRKRGGGGPKREHGRLRVA